MDAQTETGDARATTPAAVVFGAMEIQTNLPAAPAGSGPLTVLYDSDCGVCTETIRRLRRWDREDRFEFMPLRLASSSGRPALMELAALGHLGDAIHVIDESTGRVVTGGHAALAILDALPGGWLLRPWAALPPTAMAADVVYRVAARHRERLTWLMGLRDEVRCPIAHSGQAAVEDPGLNGR